VSTITGGIIAAGDGSRLRRDGFAAPKPLVRVGGTALIERVIENFEAAGIDRLVVIVNERERACARFVRERFGRLSVECIVKTTRSSLESFLEVTAAAGAGRMLVSTVDAWCPPADFARFVEAAVRRPSDDAVLGVTPLVADENPLWVDLDRDGRVTALGGQRGAFVTAGLYLVPERVRRLAPPRDLGRLREFLAWLHREGHTLWGEALPAVVDVDRAEDVRLALALERERPSRDGSPTVSTGGGVA
jgi:NDP-sugar pyrophosphorylase family protein